MTAPLKWFLPASDDPRQHSRLNGDYERAQRLMTGPQLSAVLVNLGSEHSPFDGKVCVSCGRISTRRAHMSQRALSL